MNIKEAKNEIINSMKSYFSKDEFGNFRIPTQKQRPIFMIGPPGIGKTAIMEQISQDIGVGLVTYSMTHHTRQSALGLPYIAKRTYKGLEYDVSEFTMSEIIASVYNMIEEHGHDEGILFLDEVNCVSETLAPIMLQFLQYKIFGMHSVPEGWIIVTAGNPPEYNKSVREYDIATWDRLKKIEVQPDYGVWKEYAYKSGIHGSISSYLEIRKDDFYKVETTVDGKRFVTPRGWEDLSQIIKLYEENYINVTQKLVEQYLQHETIAKKFSVYYDLYNKYKVDYQIDKILMGTESETIRNQARNAKFDERLTLLSLLIDSISITIRAAREKEQTIGELIKIIKNIKFDLVSRKQNAINIIEKNIETVKSQIESGNKTGNLSVDKIRVLQSTAKELNKYHVLLMKQSLNNQNSEFELIKMELDKYVEDFKKYIESTKNKLDNLFSFMEKVYGEGQELLVLVTELTINPNSAIFISKYGCEAYFRHNKELLFYDRQKQIISEIEKLDI